MVFWIGYAKWIFCRLHTVHGLADLKFKIEHFPIQKHARQKVEDFVILPGVMDFLQCTPLKSPGALKGLFKCLLGKKFITHWKLISNSFVITLLPDTLKSLTKFSVEVYALPKNLQRAYRGFPKGFQSNWPQTT